MTNTIPFEEFAEFIREQAGISPSKPILPTTLFESDLGITGDDGCELLKATEAHFRVALSTKEDGYRKAFGLAPDEYLFHSEGLSLFPSAERVRELSVGELYEVVVRCRRGV